ncbi:MAG: hypothetical protein WA579_00760 [Rhodomicrobium sp.]
MFALLRTADRPLETREITNRLAAAKGIDPSDTQALGAVHKTILGLLNGGKDKGFIQGSKAVRAKR